MSAENILVVDDEEIIGIALSRELSDKGYNVDYVLNGAEALKVAKHKKYDIVFIDKSMPGMDGIETCRAIKQINPCSMAIFMTGSFDHDNILKEKEFVQAGGGSFFLYKPFARGEVQEVVQKVLGKTNS
ncbi:MAG: response regulator [Candidatus Omnitrophica bacterium]|nr:response regulator [Candidatus Omnitrophota bacterium]